MTIKQLLNKAFIGGEWFVGYRPRGSEQSYEIVDTPQNMWIADPFLYETAGEHYLFVELYDKKRRKAGIGYYQFVEGIPEYKGMIIDRPYHMSYPCVFEYNGAHYMIPESSANETVDLYRAEHFPDKWVHDTTLISGSKIVDTTVVSDAGRYVMFTYQAVQTGWELVRYELDMAHKRVSGNCKVHYSKNTGRPAGNFYGAAQQMRPAQDCSEKYGKSLILYEASPFATQYHEYEKQRITAEMLRIPIKATRIHTINQDSCYEVADFFVEKLDLLHGVKIFIRQRTH